MNLQAEIQELRSVRAGARAESPQDDGEPHESAADAATENDATAPAGLMQLSVAAEAARAMAPASEESSATRSYSESTEPEPEPKRVVQFVNGAARMSISVGNSPATSRSNSIESGANQSAGGGSGARGEVGLPPGWQRVIHDSGLPCFVNEALQIVTWTRPYALDPMSADKDFLNLVKTHVPPLSVFSRHNIRARPSQPVPARRRASEDDTRSKGEQGNPEGNNGSRKRRIDAVTGSTEPKIGVRRNGDAMPLVEVNGKPLESPEGKSVHAFLREFAMAVWKAVPQYNFSKHDDSEHPFACSVRILDRQYPSIMRSTRQLAKEAAAEAVLEEHVPRYWVELKKQGRVGKQAVPPPPTKDEMKKIPEEPEPLMSLAEFKTLPIGDPRILQACMELSVKTPAQVVQEYQNRNRGISVNYNTIPHEVDGQKLFKTIVTAGSTAAEGIASTKKVAKQLAAQSLLALLHQRLAKSYYEVADLYSSSHKGFHAEYPDSSSGLSVRIDVGGGSSTRASPSKKMRRSSPNHAAAIAYGAGYGRGAGPPTGGWDGYSGYDNGSSWQQRAEGYSRKNERIVEYYRPHAAAYPPAYYSNPSDWGYGRPPPPQYAEYGPATYAHAGPPMGYVHPVGTNGPPPSYPYADPRGSAYNRTKGSHRCRNHGE